MTQVSWFVSAQIFTASPHVQNSHPRIIGNEFQVTTAEFVTKINKYAHAALIGILRIVVFTVILQLVLTIPGVGEVVTPTEFVNVFQIIFQITIAPFFVIRASVLKMVVFVQVNLW